MPYLVIPNIVNAVLFAIAGYFLFSYSGDWATAAGDWLPSWLSFMEGVVEVLVWVLVIALFAMILATTFSMITGILIAPFLAILSEKIEGQLRETNYPELKLGDIIGKSIKRELERIKYILTRLIILALLSLALGFIPGVNLLIPVIWFFYNAWMKSIEFCDYAADNNGHDLQATLAKLKANRIYALGFGSAAYLATIIPVVNLFAMPIAVCGGTHLWVKRIETDH